MMSDIFLKKLRNIIGFDAILSIIFGALILFWPTHSASVVAALIGLAFIAIGISHIASVFDRKDEDGWARVGNLVIGAVYFIAGVFTFINLYAATIYLFIIVGLLVGMTWILEGIIEFGSLKYYTQKGWAMFSALISIIGGIALLFAPLLSAIFLWQLLEASLLVLGIIKLLHFFAWKR